MQYDDGDREENVEFIKYSIEEEEGQDMVKVADHKPGTYETIAPEQQSDGKAAAGPFQDAETQQAAQKVSSLCQHVQVEFHMSPQAPSYCPLVQ